MDVDAALRRLQAMVPLADRRARLPGPVGDAHGAVLRAFVERGRPPSPREVASVGGPEALARLAAADLVVLDHAGQVAGAYPFSARPTPHRLRLRGHELHAMCALDALAVAPAFGEEVVVRSACRVTGDPVRVVQRRDDVVDVRPPQGVHVGIRWSPVQGAAARSL